MLGRLFSQKHLVTLEKDAVETVGKLWKIAEILHHSQF
jgi:hypothetical protein